MWGLMSAPWRVVSAVMNRAQPVLVFKPMPLFTSPHSFGTCSIIRTASLLASGRQLKWVWGGVEGGDGGENWHRQGKISEECLP